MTTPSSETVRLTIARADNRCEYCRMHQSLQGATFHIEHIVPRIAGGDDDESNLCLACPSCNFHKSIRTSGNDPDTGREADLFHPRRDTWTDHFIWLGFEIRGLTPTGRATAATLEMNAPRRVRIREAEALFDLFPE